MVIKRHALTFSQKNENAMGVTPAPHMKHSHLNDYRSRFGDSFFIVCKDCSDEDAGSESNKGVKDLDSRTTS